MSYKYETQWDSPSYTPDPFLFKSIKNCWIKVSKKDQSLLEKYIWSFSDGYAKRYQEKTIDGHRVRWVEYLHRVITGAKSDELVDHINGDRSDNRRSNLRIVGKSINALNTDKRHGTYYSERNKRWYSKLTVDKKTRSLGGFDTRDEANRAYLIAKKEVLSVV